MIQKGRQQHKHRERETYTKQGNKCIERMPQQNFPGDFYIVSEHGNNDRMSELGSDRMAE